MNTQAATSPVKPNPVLLGLDRVVDFATLGEYRVVTDSARQAGSATATSGQRTSSGSTSRRAVVAARVRRPAAPPRPRSRLARERVRG